MEAAQRTLRPQMEARDLQEPGERINSAKESITCFELNRDRTKRRAAIARKRSRATSSDNPGISTNAFARPLVGRVYHRKPECNPIDEALTEFLPDPIDDLRHRRFRQSQSRAAPTNDRA
jgi:hypothetical protein